MDFSKLDSNEKLATYGAIASVVGPILATAGYGVFGVGWLTLLLAIAMLAVVFLPQMSPQTNLPGSKGSLMLVVGGIAAVFAVLALLSGIGLIGLFGVSPVFVIGWLLGIAGGLLMGWAGWMAFQAEGGKFQLGSAGSTTPPARPTDTSAAPPPAAAPSEPMTTPPPPSEPMTSGEPPMPPSGEPEDRTPGA